MYKSKLVLEKAAKVGESPIHMAASLLSNDPKRAVKKHSLPKGLWKWILIGFPRVLGFLG